MTAAFVANVSKSRSLLMVAAALLFVAAGVAFLLHPQPIADTVPFLPSMTLVQLVGLASLLFGIAGAIGWSRQLFRREPVMEIGSQGILWRRWSEQVIPWSAIEHAQPMSVRRQNFLSLWLHDPAAYPSKTMLGRLAAANKSMGFGDIALSVHGTDRSFQELLDAVAAHLRKFADR